MITGCTDVCVKTVRGVLRLVRKVQEILVAD